jgi:hypothetical protein
VVQSGNATEPFSNREVRVDAAVQQAGHLGFGRIVVSERKATNMLAILA